MRGPALLSLSARVFLIVLGGVLLAIALTSGLHHYDRARLFGEYRERTAVGHIGDAVLLLAALPPAERLAAVGALPDDRWAAAPEGPAGLAAPAFAEALNERLGDAARVREARREAPADCSEGWPGCAQASWAKIAFKDGQALWLGYKGQDRPRRYQAAGLRERIGVFVGVMALAAWGVVRIALRPLRRLAEAVDGFGRDIAHPPMDEAGPSEVRRAAQAFNAMQERIRGHMAERARILAAVAHDLKTPLTRMRLRLEKCADEALKERLQADLAAMQALLDEGLELARSLDAGEPAQVVALDALLQSQCDDAADAGLDVVYEGEEGGVLVLGRPGALGRVFANLIDNAVKYGGHARVRLERAGGQVRVSVVDGGPGVPEASLEEVLKPFVRLEASRSRDSGGTGLGLAIAANLLRGEQGRLALRNRREGGLEAQVELPLAPAETRRKP
jgi:signal transduction histidine kinase